MRLVYVHIYVQLYFMREELPESETVEVFCANLAAFKKT